MAFKSVSNDINFPNLELDILDFWKENDVFKRSIKNNEQSKKYTFYDGPPFATGLPHYGHLVASILKDVVPRYWTMKGFGVDRVFGWDCHGLPIEYEIDKELGISGRKGVETFGIKNYNNACRGIVLRYTSEWEKTITRLGRWVDFENGYRTMDATFMESVWWIFKQIWDKGLIYQGFRVMPYSTAIATPLSNFEAGSNYQAMQDPSITVMMESHDFENTAYLVWTTTPWTLPSNLALCVNSEISYVRIYVPKYQKHFILSEKRLAYYFPKNEPYNIIDKFKGLFLEGKTYTPVFSYFVDSKEHGAFKVLLSDHVTEDDGSGIVHTAPAFGEDDFNICKKYGIPIVLPIDDDGHFTSEVPDFQGQYVKDADKNIISYLKDKKVLFKQDTIVHNVPLCWRTDKPLIYRAVSSWFVKVESLREEMLESNSKTHWVPENLRDGRFFNWLENARDWNISRNRYWGTPLPIWKNDTTGEYICIGSINELYEKSNVKVDDLHRETIDEIEIKDPNGNGVFKRVSEVLDCWFESGSMPYAQMHYPFENKTLFDNNFPADFIAEGLDQTRGWFYTLTVLGTILFGKSPFKNVIVNGMVLAEDGKKMSKRLKNYPDPAHIFDTYGADALRLYLIQSPVMKADELRFSETGVKDIIRRILLKWWNSYSFFMNYAVIDKWTPKETHSFDSDNILDKWVISRLQSLLKRTEHEMAVYHIYNVVPALIDFIEDLTNTYIRLNRKRFWTEESSKDKDSAYQTLYYVLVELSKAMAPFTPFIAEHIYQNLTINKSEKDSVHLQYYPIANDDYINTNMEEGVLLMQRVMLLCRNIRENTGIKIKIPLKKLSLIHRKKEVLEPIKQFSSYLKEELNFFEIEYLQNEDDYVELTAKGNGAVLGKRLGKKFANINKEISRLTSSQIALLENGETITIEDEVLQKEDVVIYRKVKEHEGEVISDSIITILVDTTVSEAQTLYGFSREIVNRIQKLRKSANFNLNDRIHVGYNTNGLLKTAILQHRDYIAEQTLSLEILEITEDTKTQTDITESFDIDGYDISISLTRLR